MDSLKVHFQAWKVRNTTYIMCLRCKIEIFFSTWHSKFSSDVKETLAFHKFCIWVQFLGVNQYLCNVDYLNLLENQLGKVLLVKIVDSFRADTSNSKIRMLVDNISNLFNKIELQGPFKVEQKLCIQEFQISASNVGNSTTWLVFALFTKKGKRCNIQFLLKIR